RSRCTGTGRRRRHRRGQRRLYEAAQRRQRGLEATGEVTAELLAGTDAAEALQLIANRAQELSGADFTLIALPEDLEAESADVAELVIAVSVGLDTDTFTTRIPVAGSTTGAVFTDHVPRNVPKLAY